MSKINTGISELWEPVAKSWTGNEGGQHCHWCKHIKNDDGYCFCNKEGCVHNDGQRIRSWDGEYCAKECGHFEIDEWYKSDDNFHETFNKK